MNFDEAFVREVRANPHDDEARLILADFLDDSGDPLGEFIRIQLALGSFDGEAEGRIELEKREADLLHKHGESWLNPLRKLGVQGIGLSCFQRGMVEHIRISPEDFASNGEEICRLSPALHCLKLTKSRNLNGFTSLKIPDQIRKLDLSSTNLSDESTLDDFLDAQDSRLNRIEGLNMEFNQLGDRHVTMLVPYLFEGLHVLQLGVNKIGPAGVSAIARLIGWPNLTSLSLKLNRLDETASHAIAVGANLKNLTSLDLASNPIGDQGAVDIILSPNLRKLQHLNLRDCGLTPEFSRMLDDSQISNSLKTIDIRNNDDRLFDSVNDRIKNSLVR